MTTRLSLCRTKRISQGLHIYVYTSILCFVPKDKCTENSAWLEWLKWTTRRSASNVQEVLMAASVRVYVYGKNERVFQVCK